MTHIDVCTESQEALDELASVTAVEYVKNCIISHHHSDKQNIEQSIITFIRDYCLKDLEPHYLEESTSGDKQDPLKTVEAQLRNGWTTGGGMRVSLKENPNWDEYKQFSRNVRYKIHSWVMLDSLLTAEKITREHRYLDYAVQIADDWISTFISPSKKDEFAWYDMAVGQRATKLAYMLRRLIENDAPNDQIFRFIIAAEIHLIELLQEDRIALHSNHGLFQMAGLLALGRSLPWMKRSRTSCDFAELMIEKMLRGHFASDGLHLEHSPDYHLYMVNHLQGLKNSGWLSSEAEPLNSLVDSVEESAHWLATPNHNVIPIGDTANNVAMSKRWSGYREKLNLGLKLFEVGGLLIHNTNISEEISQLVFSAQFHSRQHKHADDLNILYSHRNRPLLVDPGTFTYQYDIPERMYCESTRAHNAVEIDGLNYSRFRHDSFGSAIEIVAHSDELLLTIGKVKYNRLISAEIPNNKINKNDSVPVDITHRRIVIEYPNRFLAIIDDLSSEEIHEYTPWYHFPPDYNLRADSKTRLGLYDDNQEKVCQIQCYDSESESINSTRIRGQKTPNLQGWYSHNGRELIENDALGYQVIGGNKIVATIFDFEMSKTGQPYIRSGTSGRYLRFALTQGEGKTDIRIITDLEGNYSFELESDGISKDLVVKNG